MKKEKLRDKILTSPESHNGHVWIRQIPYLVLSVVTTWERNPTIAKSVYTTRLMLYNLNL